MSDNLPNKRYPVNQLIEFAAAALQTAKLDHEKSLAVAEVLVEADLLGHTTHGLQLLPPYVKELTEGNMLATGEPVVISDHGAAVAWDGNYLPGPWLIKRAISLALSRMSGHPVFTLVIQKCHHIACLAAYLEQVTDRGFIILLSCSDPKNKTVAPFGSTKGVYSPNPLAAGIPTEKDPILIDVSMSATANGYVKRSFDENSKLSHPWLLTPEGLPTDDPASFYANPPSTILPLGGTDSGYKGFALGILIEALTNALCGYGRADEPEKWTASVFLQLIDPSAFGGADAFKRQMQFLGDECLAAGDTRLPGQRGLALKRYQQEHGLALYPTVLNGLNELSKQLEIPLE
jgi:LDH2 family malate/lactate/ureidoglycolate dehydrogenase